MATGRHYGVVGLDQAAGARHDNGRWSIADPRMPEAKDRQTCIIQSLNGTWRRPFTTLELAALQSLVDPEEQLVLDGLLLAEQSETFMLSNTPSWVRNVAVARGVAQATAPQNRKSPLHFLRKWRGLCGEHGIRTRGGLAPSPTYQVGAIDRSASSGKHRLSADG